MQHALGICSGVYFLREKHWNRAKDHALIRWFEHLMTRLACRVYLWERAAGMLSGNVREKMLRKWTASGIFDFFQKRA